MSWSFFAPRTSKPRKPAKPRRVGLEALEERDTPATLVALTRTDMLLTFDTARPTQLLTAARIRGLDQGEDVRNIDSRPANGLLYGVTNFNQLYTLNPRTGQATKVGSARFSPGLNAPRIGLDFNPTVDRLRGVNVGDVNLRVNPNTGATVDGNPNLNGTQPDTPLAYAPGDASQGRNPAVVDVAYTNNFLGATSTTLYAIDAATDALVTIGGLNGQPSPNGGELRTVGRLGVNVGGYAGFEITADGTAYAAIDSRFGPYPARLYTINLTTGKATAVGTFIGSFAHIEGLAELSRVETVYGVTAGNRLVTFRADDPGTFLSSVPISGLTAGESVEGLDVRTATGELFALTSTNRVLRIDPATGQAIQVGSPLDAALFRTGTAADIDFNPTVDRLRLVNALDDNLRYNPVTVAPVDGNAAVDGVQGDTALAYPAVGDPASGQDPNVVAVAYDRNDNDAATPTTLFGIDSTQNTLVRQGAVDGNPAGVGGSPNGGQLATIGSLGVNPTDLVSFDVGGAGTTGNGVALAAMQLEGETVSRLFTINLATGAATAVGIIGTGELIRAIAVAPQRFVFDAPVVVASEGGQVARIAVRRVGGSGGTATVQFSTSDGTARAGVDYTAVSLLLTFAPGETIKVVEVPVLQDRADEPSETVNLTLSAPAGNGAQLGTPATATLVLADDDGFFPFG